MNERIQKVKQTVEGRRHILLIGGWNERWAIQPMQGATLPQYTERLRTLVLGTFWQKMTAAALMSISCLSYNGAAEGAKLQLKEFSMLPDKQGKFLAAPKKMSGRFCQKVLNFKPENTYSIGYILIE